MRTAWYWIVAVFGTAFTLILMVPAGYLFPKTRAAARVGRMWGRIMLFGAGVRLETHSAEHAAGGPYMIVANHASMLDIPACFAAVPLDFRFVSRPFFFKIPLLGWCMHAAGHVSLDPQQPRRAARVLHDLGRFFEAGRSLLLYPEGTRSPDGRVRAYKRGPFLAAIQNGVPVLPLRLEGTHVCQPKGSLRVKGGTVRATFGAAISTAGLKPPDARRLASEIEEWTRG